MFKFSLKYRVVLTQSTSAGQTATQFSYIFSQTENPGKRRNSHIKLSQRPGLTINLNLILAEGRFGRRFRPHFGDKGIESICHI